MTSSLRRFGITLALLGFASILPPTAGAQAPPYLTQWGTPGTGDGQFLYPTGIAVDANGNVYVSDNNRIQKFTSAGVYLTQWGTGGIGSGQFQNPFGVAVDAAGDVYVADANNSRVQKFTSSGTYLTQWGTRGSGDGQFGQAAGVAADASGNIYVTDVGNFRVQKFTSTGAYLTQWGALGSGNGEFYFQTGVTADGAGNVYVGDGSGGNHRIQKFSNTGTYITQWGSLGSEDGQFNTMGLLAVDSRGNVYVADRNNHRIQVFTGAGTFLTKWGTGGSGAGQFNSPGGVAVDAGGNVYVADTRNHRIQKFGPVPAPPIAMAFDFAPNTLNLASQGLWVTGFLEPASPLAAGDIDLSSIRLNGTVPVDPVAPTALGDHDGDGVTDLMVKFNRAAAELTLTEGDQVPVNVTGTLGSDSFSGSDDIRVVRAVVSAPVAGSHLAAGSVTQVRWETPSEVSVQSVALLYSLDDGSNWSLIAGGQPNTGSYDWTVPNVQTDQAKVAVEMVEPADGTVEGVLGVSEAFSIEALVGVGDGGPAQFALRGVTPNPTPRELRVSFSLRDTKSATLALFDVSGRQLVARRVDGMGPGWHAVTLGARNDLPAGVYVIRLTQDGRSLTTRAAVVR
jgi:DNA-binding beta-propeller fold protein YncE